MLEPRFNLDTLAMLLNIPPQKTLLRRHLTTNFNNLVGTQAQQEKREYTQAAAYTPLSITAKVKVRYVLRWRKWMCHNMLGLCLNLREQNLNSLLLGHQPQLPLCSAHKKSKNNPHCNTIPRLPQH